MQCLQCFLAMTGGAQKTNNQEILVYVYTYTIIENQHVLSQACLDSCEHRRRLTFTNKKPIGYFDPLGGKSDTTLFGITFSLISNKENNQK